MSTCLRLGRTALWSALFALFLTATMARAAEPFIPLDPCPLYQFEQTEDGTALRHVEWCLYYGTDAISHRADGTTYVKERRGRLWFSAADGTFDGDQITKLCYAVRLVVIHRVEFANGPRLFVEDCSDPEFWYMQPDGTENFASPYWR